MDGPDAQSSLKAAPTPRDQGPRPAQPPTIQLPKGGGAIRGMGEKFSVNPATGTGSFSVPLGASPGRSGFGPDLSLTYDSAAGNGVFGLGWSLEQPSITRKTDRGVPLYGVDDVFILSGAEDLVPLQTPPVERNGYLVQRFRPRCEAAFSRIEQWSHLTDPAETFWRTISSDNITTVYGDSYSSRVRDPVDPTRIHSWLISVSHDSLGNAIAYQYTAEDGLGVDAGLSYEHGRSTAQRYLTAIRYGNRFSRLDPAHAADWDSQWMFEVVLDYGQDLVVDDPAGDGHHYSRLADPQPWPVRPDCFSTYRAGFEVRTYRRCERILMFHRFDELGAGRTLVRDIGLAYDTTTGYSLLTSITASGHRRMGARYRSASMPRLDFEYSPARFGDAAQSLTTADLHGPTTWIDLDGEGLPGGLTRLDRGWWYRRNQGGGRLGPATLQRTSPNAEGRLMDLAGDGSLDLVQTGIAPGFYERTTDGDWASHRAFTAWPSVDLDDPWHRLTDVTGDGLPDAVRLTGQSLDWSPSLGEDGYAPARPGRSAPPVSFADALGSLFLADMTGDGLTDIVRITNGDVRYWPNCGHGHFGKAVVMADAPRVRDFDPKQVRLADIDGSGPADLLYLHPDGTRAFLNRSGNSWSRAVPVHAVAYAEDVGDVEAVDLLGDGTTCLVWTSPVSSTVRFVPLMADGKPHLLTEIRNNLGSATTLTYESSTQQYLRDAEAGTPWITRLPFPVHVVTAVVTRDLVAGNVFSTTYSYHHGYYDGHEREFRGFGRVDQHDSEVFDTGANQNRAFAVPPVLTRTWFHTGIERSGLMSDEYNGDQLVAEPDLPEPMTDQERRQAYRALRGTMLRQEVYGLDGSPQEPHPYQVKQASTAVRMLQPAGLNPHAVFLTHPAEAVTVHTERQPGDPRTTAVLTLDVNDYGQVQRSAEVAYGRTVADMALPADARAEQAAMKATVTDNTYTTVLDDPDDHRIPMLHTSTTYELTGLTGEQHVAELTATLAGAAAVDYESAAPAGPALRATEVERIQYLRDDLAGPARWGAVVAKGLIHQVYRQAFTPGLLAGAYPVNVTALLPAAGYVEMDGRWWVPSGTVSYGDLTAARRDFHRPVRFHSPFGAVTSVEYDTYLLNATSSTDAIGNRTSAQVDYRVLAPWAVTDANGNRTEAAYDVLGMLTATATMGAAGQGDRLDGFEVDLTQAQVEAVMADPLATARALMGRASVRIVHDHHAYARHGSPPVVATLAREVHAMEAPSSPTQCTLAYSDGFGRGIQRKVRAEPANGWATSGWTVFNNKGDPVQRFEPFFTASHAYTADGAVGSHSTVFYDPPGRVVAVLHPDATYAKTVIAPWQQWEYDGNDTVATDPRTDPHVGHIIGASLQTLPGWDTWLAARAGQDVATKTLAHADTPLKRVLDPLGRGFLSRADNAGPGPLDTTLRLDIEGNTRAVIDPLGRTVHTAVFDMLGNPVRRDSVDAGTRWTLADVAGQPIRLWDSRGHEFAIEYDVLRRPVTRIVVGNDPVHSDPDTLAEPIVIERTVYGEGQPGDQARNLRARVYQRFDAVGTVTNAYDFKGNVSAREREILPDPSRMPDWSQPQPGGERFSSTTRYDALNRAVQTVAAHRPGDPVDVTQRVFNEAGLLTRVDVWLDRASEPGGLLDVVAVPASTSVGVLDMDYDAKGQRTRLVHKNGTVTTYDYDPDTYRLRRLRTTRGAGFNDTVQDLQYVYDPAGNLVSVSDSAQSTVFFRNQVVDAGNDYTYDATYRLARATGREHVGQGRVPASADDLPALRLPQPGDGAAMGRYIQTYDYDDAGNLTRLRHFDAVPAAVSWTRSFTYAAGGNRLQSTGVGASTQTFDYDPHGCVLAMAHVPELTWNMHGQLRSSTRQLGNGSTRYVYDADGNRVRKVRLDAGGTVVEEVLYLGDMEIYQRSGTGLRRRTLHVNDQAGRVVSVQTRNAVDDGSPRQVVRYQHGNHLGSAVLETDASAAILSYEEYSPYGSTTYQAVAAGLDKPSKRYRFAGHERDEETGFYAIGARYYAPWLARWTSADPAGEHAGANLYRYCNDSPVMLTDPSGTDPPKPKITPLVTDAGPTGVAGQLQFHDLFSANRSVSGHGQLGLAGRASFLLQVPQLGLDTSGLADVRGVAGFDTSLGRAGAALTGGLLLGDSSGLNLGVSGSGSFRFDVPERIGLGGLPGSLVPSMTQGEGDLRAGGALSVGSLSLATFRARATLSGGRFEGSLQAVSIADLAQLRLDAKGSVTASGDVSVDSAQLRASAGVPGLGVQLSASGTGNGSGGLDLQANARVSLLGGSLRASATGTASGSGLSLSGTFSGTGPLATSYITGAGSYSSTGGASGWAFIGGLTYTPGVSLTDPAPTSPGTAAVLGTPASPWTPSGLTVGASLFQLRQGQVNYISGGFMPDLSERILTNPRFGVSAQWHF